MSDLTLAVGQRVVLRDRLPTDLERFIHWQTHGVWRRYDAPWEGFGDSLTVDQEKKIRSYFLNLTQGKQPVPRTGGMITLGEGQAPVGMVNRYEDPRFNQVYYIGISICEDAYLDQGLGTEALELWLGYLFKHSSVHKIECHTWSLNLRMMHVAEKLGFKLEGRERELVCWQGVWQDRLRYGLLRAEWEQRCP